MPPSQAGSGDRAGSPAPADGRAATPPPPPGRGPASTAAARRPVGVAPALLLVVLIWAGTYSGIKAAQALVPPVPLAAFRTAVGTAVLLAVLTLRRRPLPRLARREWGTLLLAGLSGTTVFQLCMVGGLRFTTPARSALMIALNPVFTALLAWVVLGERPGARRAAGILLSFGGVAVVLLRAGGAGGGSLLGDAISLGAALSWAVFSVAGKPLLAAHPPLEVSTLALLAGTLPLLPLGGPGLAAVPWSRLDAGTWLLLGYLSAVTIGVTYVLWYWALQRAATARVVAFTNLTPLLAAAISVSLGQEPLGLPLVLGGAAVVAGVMLAQPG